MNTIFRSCEGKKYLLIYDVTRAVKKLTKSKRVKSKRDHPRNKTKNALSKRQQSMGRCPGRFTSRSTLRYYETYIFFKTFWKLILCNQWG